MRKKILIIDTSILCVWLDVPGMNECGSKDDLWDKTRIKKTLDTEEKKGAFFVLPHAVIIETGNHIAQSDRAWQCSKALCDIIKKSLDSSSPWAEFSHQDVLWNPERMRKLADEWPDYAKSGLSIGDMTIKAVAEFYSEARYEVSILTGDAGLKAFEPVATQLTPRRYKKKP